MPTTPDVTPGLDPLLSPAQVAELLGMSLEAIRKRIWRGLIPSVKIGRQNRVRRSALEAYLSSLPDRVSRATNGGSSDA